MIDEKKSKLLCQILNDILIEDDENESRVAISWLCLVRPHSVFLRNYELIFKKRTYFFYNCLNLFVSNLKNILINFIKSFNSKNKIKKINSVNCVGLAMKYYYRKIHLWKELQYHGCTL